MDFGLCLLLYPEECRTNTWVGEEPVHDWWELPACSLYVVPYSSWRYVLLLGVVHGYRVVEWRSGLKIRTTVGCHLLLIRRGKADPHGPTPTVMAMDPDGGHTAWLTGLFWSKLGHSRFLEPIDHKTEGTRLQEACNQDGIRWHSILRGVLTP